jgi:chromosome segregation ATPase
VSDGTQVVRPLDSSEIKDFESQVEKLQEKLKEARNEYNATHRYIRVLLDALDKITEERNKYRSAYEGLCK